MEASRALMEAIGVTGRSAIDGLFPHATYEVEGQSLIVRIGSRTHTIATADVARRGAKTAGAINAELWAEVGDVRVGGGGPNTCVAAKLAVPEVALRYLDACTADEQVTRALAYPDLQIRHIGLETVSTNVLLGVGNNRTIIKQSKSHTRAFTPDRLNDLLWITACRCIRANSVKHIEVAEYLANQAIRGDLELHVVPTAYLPPDFIASRWLGAASELCTSQDEIGEVLGWDLDQGLSEAPAVLARLRVLAPRATILLTRGDDGVVVSMPDQVDPVHVRLERNWDNLQQHVAKDPTRVCGAGDACAAGSTLMLCTGRSVLQDINPAYPPGVKAAIAGSALAIRWIGWMPGLRCADFSVRRLAVPKQVSSLEPAYAGSRCVR